MESVVLVSDVAWVRRGVAKHEPHLVKVDAENMKDLIQGGEAETSDQDASDAEETQHEEMPQGLRGSNANVAADAETADEDTAMKEYMKEYEEDAGEEKGPSIRSVAMYSSPLEDPHITRHTDSDEEEEKEDFLIKADDNLVVVASVDRGSYSLEVRVFNESAGDWYVHHDYLLDAPPLCIEPFHYDPGSDDKRGNLVAVGTIEGSIQVWDLDIVNACEPVIAFRSGSKGKGKGKRKKRDGSSQGHRDAVLSCRWNSLTPHVMASGDASGMLILWDIDETKCASQIDASADGGIQTLSWHPAEDSILLSGTLTGVLSAVDCRTEQSHARWNLGEGVQCEKAIWDIASPFHAVVSSDDGRLRYVDMRRPGEFLFTVECHEGAIEGISFSPAANGLLASAGADGMVGVWKVNPSTGVERIGQKNVSMGALHALSFSPNSPFLVCVGGESGENTKVIDLKSMFSEVESHFPLSA